jgi:hypothetical protein
MFNETVFLMEVSIVRKSIKKADRSFSQCVSSAKLDGQSIKREQARFSKTLVSKSPYSRIIRIQKQLGHIEMSLDHLYISLSLASSRLNESRVLMPAIRIAPSKEHRVLFKSLNNAEGLLGYVVAAVKELGSFFSRIDRLMNKLDDLSDLYIDTHPSELKSINEASCSKISKLSDKPSRQISLSSKASLYLDIHIDRTMLSLTENLNKAAMIEPNTKSRPGKYYLDQSILENSPKRGRVARNLFYHQLESFICPGTLTIRF